MKSSTEEREQTSSIAAVCDGDLNTEILAGCRVVVDERIYGTGKQRVPRHDVTSDDGGIHLAHTGLF